MPDKKIIAVLGATGAQGGGVVRAIMRDKSSAFIARVVSGQVIERLPQCRVISRLGAGTDRIDVTTATRLGMVVANVPDFCINC